MNLVPLAFALQFHDSEVGRIDAADGALTVRFSAASVRSPTARAGGAVGTGQVLNLQMRLHGASGPPPPGDCIGRLSGGLVTVDGKAVSPVHVPSAHRGRVVVTLNFANGRELAAQAQSVEFDVAGEARFVESYAC
jgi:hypothetical protein